MRAMMKMKMKKKSEKMSRGSEAEKEVGEA